jgi:hypothetical protein
MQPAGRAAAPWLFSVAPSLLTLGARWSGKDRALARLTGARG